MFREKYNELFEKSKRHTIEKDAVSFLFSNIEDVNNFVEKYSIIAKNDGILLSKTKNSITLQIFPKN